MRRLWASPILRIGLLVMAVVVIVGGVWLGLTHLPAGRRTEANPGGHVGRAATSGRSAPMGSSGQASPSVGSVGTALPVLPGASPSAADPDLQAAENAGVDGLKALYSFATPAEDSLDSALSRAGRLVAPDVAASLRAGVGSDGGDWWAQQAQSGATSVQTSCDVKTWEWTDQGDHTAVSLSLDCYSYGQGATPQDTWTSTFNLPTVGVAKRGGTWQVASGL